MARLSYHGTGGALLGLVLKSALLTIITLGIYSFWGKNAVRAYHYNHTEIEGDRFAYHGTGGELLRGALKAFGIMFLIFVVLGALLAVAGGEDASPVATVSFTVAFYAIFAALIIVAINGARKYRLSRSSLRGIRFSFHGELGEFFVMMARGTLFSIVTLSFYLPYFANQRRAFLVDNARFGSEPFRYDGDGQDLVGPYIRALLLTIPTLGLSWLWYRAFEHRYFWGHTAFREARFTSTVNGGEMLSLYLTNILLVIFTLGIGSPWAVMRAHRYFAENLALHGDIEWASIEQRAPSATATAEGLAEGFDIDVGIGM